MKILYFITKSELGGAQTHVSQLMEYMHSQGHTVGVSAHPGGPLEQRAHELGIKFYPNRFFRNTFNPLSIVNAFRTVKKATRDFQPELVHVHSSMAGFIARIAIRGKIATIFTAHSWAFTDGVSVMRKYIAIIAEKCASYFTKKIICVSEFDKQLALRYRVAPSDKLVTIYNGVQSVQEIEKLAHTPLRAITVGRFAHQKRFDLLITAIAALPDFFKKNIHLNIVGDGEQKQMLLDLVVEKKLTKQVSFLSAVENTEVFQLLNSSDMFILISRYEGFPMTILEAMAAGVPVIASSVGGIPEAIDDTCGILVENTIESIATALMKMITDSEQRIIMGISAKERFEKLFSLKQCLKNTEAVYDEVRLDSTSRLP